MKRLFALFLAVLMIAALAVPAAAEEVNDPRAITYTITISKAVPGRIYKAYQIFTGDISGSEITEVEWGTGVSAAGQAALIAEFFGTLPEGETVTAQELAREVQTEADAKLVAGILNGASGYLQNASEAFAYNESAGKYTLSGLQSGYYLIVEETEVDDEHDSVSAYMMRLVKDVTLTPKDSVPSLDKTVADINDSKQLDPDTHLKSADYDIGDAVPFHIHIVLGNNIDEYKALGYKMTITDTMSKGLSFDEDTPMVVKYGSHTLDASCYSVSDVTVNADGTSTFNITIPNLFAMKDAASGETITPRANGNIIVNYSAILNEQAVIGSLGNPNEAYMKFSNNPNGEGEGQTPTSTAIVFTYQLNVSKVDQDMKPLTGATFALYKNDINGNWIEVTRYTVNSGTEFTFSGLDDGEYKLVEISAPSGYNQIDDMTFSIVASHDSTLISLNGERVSGVIDLTTEMEDEKITGILSTTVVNEKGAILPSTGGIGTTIFYVFGGILVFAAIVLLVTKKRMGSNG